MSGDAGEPPRGDTDWRIGVLLVAAAIALTLQEYLGPRVSYEWFAYDPALPTRHGGAAGQWWWTWWSVLGYVLVPLAVVIALPGERAREHHGGLRGLGRYGARVVAAAAALGVVLWLVSTTSAFREHYPFARGAERSAEDQARWLALTAVQLAAAEFFFRGYLLAGLRRVMGDHALFVSMVPFCLIHFNPDRPMWLVFASMALGLGLGVLAMRTRSIWPGVLLQLAVAVALDPARRIATGTRVDWHRLERLAPSAAIAVAVIGAVVALLVYARARNNVLWRGVAKLTVEQWRAIDADGGPGSAQALPPARVHLTVAVVLVVACVTLTLQEYVGQRAQYERWWPYDPATSGPYWSLQGFAWWTGWRVFGYLLLPMAVVALLPGERLRDYYVSPRGFFKHLWIYAVMFALILPAVVIASRTQVFRHTYPFYRLAGRSAFDTWSWELMYALQFLSLEFFFRGFLLQGLRRVMGANAIFVMIVPYCMIHYGKPMAETVGAIFAGVILGTLAMRTRSIWGGVVIHVGVAWTMDLLAIAQCPTDGRPCPR